MLKKELLLSGGKDKIPFTLYARVFWGDTYTASAVGTVLNAWYVADNTNQLNWDDYYNWTSNRKLEKCTNSYTFKSYTDETFDLVMEFDDVTPYLDKFGLLRVSFEFPSEGVDTITSLSDDASDQTKPYGLNGYEANLKYDFGESYSTSGDSYISMYGTLFGPHLNSYDLFFEPLLSTEGYAYLGFSD